MKTTTKSIALIAGLALPLAGAIALVTGLPGGSSNPATDGIRSPNNRPAKPLDTSNLPTARGGSGAATFPSEFRTIDGVGNNTANPSWGAAGIQLRRAVAPQYGDGSSTPAGASRPSAREASTIIMDQVGVIPNPINATDFLWQWGQFLDHDIDETPITAPGEPFDIVVPNGDPWFDPKAEGNKYIPLTRSAFVMDSGVRQQINNITSFIDASNVYGSEHDRAHDLRTNDGTGRLAMVGDLMPYNTQGHDNAPSSKDPTMFLAGDIRANEQAGLACMHTLFVREHNYWADQIAAENPEFTGDEIYEYARAIVAAEMQAITYNEFLPLLLGDGAIPEYTGYKPGVDPSISNIFATAAYRFGHTLLSPQIMRVDELGNEAPEGHLPLKDAFFSPSIVEDNGIDNILRGLASQKAQDLDAFVITDVRNFLFGAPGSGGFDLPALNIQRGRDHGLPDYNSVRVAMGLPALANISEVTSDPTNQAALASTYANVNDIDPWVGMLIEEKPEGVFVGDTLRAVFVDQFTRLRDGDRFWYTSYLPSEMIDLVNEQTLAVIIRRNTGIGDELQDNVFQLPPCEGDANGDNIVNLDDLNIILANFGSAVSEGDLNNDGVVDLQDLNVVLGLFGSSCN